MKGAERDKETLLLHVHRPLEYMSPHFLKLGISTTKFAVALYHHTSYRQKTQFLYNKWFPTININQYEKHIWNQNEWYTVITVGN